MLMHLFKETAVTASILDPFLFQLRGKENKGIFIQKLLINEFCVKGHMYFYIELCVYIVYIECT
jgi:hypothetical protein